MRIFAPRKDRRLELLTRGTDLKISVETPRRPARGLAARARKGELSEDLQYPRTGRFELLGDKSQGRAVCPPPHDVPESFWQVA
jgi:hypothetical protein